MRRLVEAEIAAVIHRGQALVGAFGIVNAVIALTARHQRWDHHLRSHAKRLAHEIFLEVRADLDQHAAYFVAERERPRQLLRPVAFEDMQIGAAHAAGADFYQCRLLRDLGPRHGANDRLRAGPVVGAYANLLHGISSGPSAIVDCSCVGGASLCEPGGDANLGIVAIKRASIGARKASRGVKRAQSLEYRSVCGSRHDGIPVPERCRRRAATSTTNLRLDRKAAIAVAWAGLIWGLFNFGFATIFSFGPSLLVERGWSIAAAGSTISIVLWLAVLSVPAGGFLADRTKRPQSILVAGCILFA